MMAHCKREGHHQDGDALAKKSKVADPSAETDREQLTLDSHVPVNDHLTSAEKNGHKGSNDEQVDSRDHSDNDKHDLNSTSEDKALCNPGVLKPQVGNLSSIEADAAEDKGSRHAMEDAWVVLPDASLDFPGQLRCAHFAIYDGHGGRLAAEFAQKNLHPNVLSAGLPHGYKSCKKSYP